MWVCLVNDKEEQDWPRCRDPGLKVQDFTANIYNSERRETYQHKTKRLIKILYIIIFSQYLANCTLPSSWVLLFLVAYEF